MLANTINLLNDKGVKYKVEQKNGVLSMAFGIKAHEKKIKASVTPKETTIDVVVGTSNHTFDEPKFTAFLDQLLELRSIQEREDEILKEFGVVVQSQATESK